jgi:hypothetical protein
MKAKMAVAMIPGKAKGTTTYEKICILLAPSIAAASSNSRGISLIKAFKSHMQKGKAKVVHARTNPNLVLYKPTLDKIINNGITNNMAGVKYIKRTPRS